MVERWRPHDVKPVSVAPDTQEDSLDEGAGLPAPVMDDDEKVSRTLLGVASGAEQVVGPSDLTTVQDSVESWVKSSEGGVASGAEQVVGPSDLTTVQDSVESWFKSSRADASGDQAGRLVYDAGCWIGNLP
jgi:hypothetical protein